MTSISLYGKEIPYPTFLLSPRHKEVIDIAHYLGVNPQTIAGTTCVIGPETNFYDRALLCGPPHFTHLEPRINTLMLCEKDTTCPNNWLDKSTKLFSDPVTDLRRFMPASNFRVQFSLASFTHACSFIPKGFFDWVLCLRQYDLSLLLEDECSTLHKVLKPNGLLLASGGLNKDIPDVFYTTVKEPVKDAYYSHYHGQNTAILLGIN